MVALISRRRSNRCDPANGMYRQSAIGPMTGVRIGVHYVGARPTPACRRLVKQTFLNLAERLEAAVRGPPRRATPPLSWLLYGHAGDRILENDSVNTCRRLSSLSIHILVPTPGQSLLRFRHRSASLARRRRGQGVRSISLRQYM